MEDEPTSDFLQGFAITLAELSRIDGTDLARRLADQWKVSLLDFAAIRVDGADLEELRRIFAGDVSP